MGQVSRSRKGSLQFVPLKRSTKKPSFKIFNESSLFQLPVVKNEMVSYIFTNDQKTKELEPATVLELPETLTLRKGYSEDKTFSVKELKSKKLSILEKIINYQVCCQFKGSKKITFRTPLPTEWVFDEKKDILNEVILINNSLIDFSKVDILGRTKGKGTQGIVKRRGTKIKKRKHYRTAKKRLIGSQGCFTPGWTSWRVPMAGQLGNANRITYNLKLLPTNYFFSEKEESLYNLKKTNKYLECNNILIVKGSIPGPSKSIAMIRDSLRK
jgi:ribosomal protein L3